MKRVLLGAVVAFAACGKVPLSDIRAGFTLADAAWFADEQTLFFFYRVTAEQGIGPASQIEVTWRTDTVDQPYTAIGDLPQVHTHVKVDCGPKALCGSASFKVTNEPRLVGIRLKYHRDGAVSLPAKLSPDGGPSNLTLNIIGPGPAHTNRSLVVYGVFDEKNETIQWRARHQFPTLRNQQVQELGLRRHFRIESPQVGDFNPLQNPFPLGSMSNNFYGYAFQPSCPLGLTELGWPAVETLGRAVFDTHQLPISASTSAAVCARSIVKDAKGTFPAIAFARKNPEVRPAFPSLRSPIRTSTQLGFLLRPCTREISKVHQAMQVQRLLLAGMPEICIDDWKDPGFPDRLAQLFRTRIEAARPAGDDMVLTLALHHDDLKGELGLVLEKALEKVLPFERDKTSPHVSGAFVFDSLKHVTQSAVLRPLVLWCPASIDAADLDKVPDAAQRTCPVLPDLPDLKLGPFRFGNLPILPTRPQYLTFLTKYSDAEAGRMTELKLLAPERTPISQNQVLGEFGVGTFFNNEVLTAAPADAFSYCAAGDATDAGVSRSQNVVFKTPLVPDPMPLANLPDLHTAAPSANYPIGLAWDFPFLVRAKYEVTLAGAATVFSLTVPFGISNPTQKYYGTELWEGGEFPMSKTLLHCTRYCDHPTFDSAGVYNVTRLFRLTFRNQCYLPRFPVPTDGEFPLDP